MADEKCDQARKPDSRQGCNVKPCGRADTLYRWVHAVTDKRRPVQTGTVRYRSYREVQIKTNRYTHRATDSTLCRHAVAVSRGDRCDR